MTGAAHSSDLPSPIPSQEGKVMLKGKMMLDINTNMLSIKGDWSVTEEAYETASSAFELSRKLEKGDSPPYGGQFKGFFYDGRTKLQETCTFVSFTPNNAGGHNVTGYGHNQIVGDFDFCGTLSLNLLLTIFKEPKIELDSNFQPKDKGKNKRKSIMPASDVPAPARMKSTPSSSRAPASTTGSGNTTSASANGEASSGGAASNINGPAGGSTAGSLLASNSNGGGGGGAAPTETVLSDPRGREGGGLGQGRCLTASAWGG